MNFKVLTSILFISLVLIGCSDDTTQPEEEIDKQALLINCADDLIIPALSNLKIEAKDLSEEITSFSANYSESNLAYLRTKYLDIIYIWQYCSMYGFGPADDVQLRQAINTFPTDTNLIKENIKSGNYSLAISSNYKAKGLPALGYLLYPPEGTNLEVYFSDENLLKYMKDLAIDIYDNTSYVYDGWQEYREKFITNLGNDAGSSLSLMINEFVFDYELAKRAKVGIPSGIFGSVLPFNFEAPHSKISNALLIKNLTSYKRFLEGFTNNNPEETDTIKEYLDAITANRNNSDLSNRIIEKLNKSIEIIEKFEAPMVEMIKSPSGKEKIDALYKNMQEMVVLIKTDMTSAMGILISYQDNDGD
ncbi:MAG: imelysin family protein [Chlorobiota bacterium]